MTIPSLDPWYHHNQMAMLNNQMVSSYPIGSMYGIYIYANIKGADIDGIHGAP